MLRVALPSIGLAAGGIVWFMRWFKEQPYSIPEPILPHHIDWVRVAKQLSTFLIEVPFVFLPLTLCAGVLLLQLNRRRGVYVLLCALLYTSAGVLLHMHHHDHLLEPTMNDTEYMLGLFWASVIGNPPIIFPLWLRAILTFATVYGAVATAVLIYRQHCANKLAEEKDGERSLPSARILGLCAPFILFYVVMLAPRAATTLYTRYMLGLAPALVLLVLASGTYTSATRVPKLCWATLVAVGFWAVIIVHNEFALTRARIDLVHQLMQAGIPRGQITDGWEGNDAYELTQAPAINEPRLVNPAGYYKHYGSVKLLCGLVTSNDSPHVRPVYGIAYFPSPCLPEAPFLHVSYSRWLSHNLNTIYVVRVAPSDDEKIRP